MASRWKAALHSRLDPLLSLPDRWRRGRSLADLPDGEYRVPVDVPYYAQFASPDRIYDYIHRGYDGLQDPNWHVFGSDDPAEYAFWAPRICALACLKMAIEAFHPKTRPSLWQLVKEGLAVKGYAVRDGRGRWLDQGWYVHAQLHLARQYGLEVVGQGYVSPLSVCHHVRAGWLVAASVTPEIGEREPAGGRYGGHLVLVFGFGWRAGRPTHFLLHNPSGRFPELQANVHLTAAHFAGNFAHRLIALRPVSPKTTGDRQP